MSTSRMRWGRVWLWGVLLAASACGDSGEVVGDDDAEPIGDVGLAQDVAAVQDVAVAGDVGPAPGVDAAAEVVEDVAPDVSQGEDVAPEVIEDVAPDVVAILDVAPEGVEDVAPDAAIDVAPDVTAVPDAAPDVVEVGDVAPDVAELADVTPDVFEDVPPEIAEDVAPEIVEPPEPIWEDHWFYEIEVLDKDTGEGVPGVQLRTTSNMVFETDANGRAAYFEPGLMNQPVWFYVAREGYELAPDGFGFVGKKLTATEGGKGTIVITRVGEPADPALYDTDDSQLLLGKVPAPWERFAITVVDAETGRGVPMVEVRSPKHTWLTDSAGRVAYHDVELMNQTVEFQLWSHGYGGPGPEGLLVLDVVPGEAAEVLIYRDNVAERLYRLTGSGIYADTWLLGLAPPTEAPLLNALVTGQDTAFSTLYGGKIFIIWGDTNWPQYPLGLFHVSGATFELPRDGGLHPSVGIDYTYFTAPNGFSKAMAPKDKITGPGPTWLGGPIALPDGDGEALFAPYGKFQGLQAYESGMAVYEPASQDFGKLFAYAADAAVHAEGHPIRVVIDGVAWLYWIHYQNLTRCRADVASLSDPSTYEAWTCFAEGTSDQLALDDAGQPVYAFRKGAAVVTGDAIDAGTVTAEQALINKVRDRDTGKNVVVHATRIHWNPYRGRYIRLFQESWGGPSFLGEVRYAEADTPMGPWVYATKIISHTGYTFYNAHQEPLLDEEHGRVVYVEGTYTNSFAGDPPPTPRYNYNQIQYRLDLADERLIMPTPVYDVSPSAAPTEFAVKQTLPDDLEAPPIAFFAPDRPWDGAVTVGDFYCHAEQTGITVALWRFEHASEPDALTVDDAWVGDGYSLAAAPLCYVWPDPIGYAFPVGDYRADVVGHDICTTLECPAGQGSCAWQPIADCCVADDDCPAGMCPAPGSTCQ